MLSSVLAPYLIRHACGLLRCRYRRIRPPELVGQTWTKRPHDAVNVVAFTSRVNTVSYWAQRAIMEAQNLQERVEVVSLLLETLRELLQLGNFNGVMELAGALNAASVNRLKHTWAEVHPKRMRVLHECRRLTGEKSAMREALANAHPPCLPYLGTYQSDITFIEDGNPDFLPADADAPANTLINFKKRYSGALSSYSAAPRPMKREWGGRRGRRK